MTIRLSSAEETALSSSAQRLKAAFVLALGGLLVSVRAILLPHLAAAGALFVLASYAVYTKWLAFLPEPFSWLTALLFFALYAVAALGYALTVSLVFALHAAAGGAENFLYELFSSIKEKVRSKINDMDEGLAKQQARLILDNSVREVLAPLKSFRSNKTVALAAGTLLSLLTLVTRSVFLARLARLSGATVNFSAVFASRATLVGALVLNFHWLCTLILWALYGLGAAVFIFNFWLVW